LIPYAKQSINKDDIDTVVDTLCSEWLTQGPKLEEFESALAEKINVKHVIAVSNGTAALHLACLAAGLQQDDLAVTSTLTFVATVNAPKYCGANTALLDIDPDTLGLSADKLQQFLTLHPETKVILPVHFAGLAQGMEILKSISGNRIIIEDAAHALGGQYENGKPVGCCEYSDMAIFSFHPVKSITTAEGGAITTNSDDLAMKLRKLRSHGIESDASKFTNDEHGSWYYEQQELGFNYRLSDLHAALGLTQLDKLESFIKRRREITTRYDNRFKDVQGITPHQSLDSQRNRSGLHLYTVAIDFEKYNTTRDSFMKKLRESGINTQVHYIPVHKQPYHKQGNVVIDLNTYSNAEQYYLQTLSIPLYPGLTDNEVEYVVGKIINELNNRE